MRLASHTVCLLCREWGQHNIYMDMAIAVLVVGGTYLAVIGYS